jgi:hypothetical protein
VPVEHPRQIYGRTERGIINTRSADWNEDSLDHEADPLIRFYVIPSEGGTMPLLLE